MLWLAGLVVVCLLGIAVIFDFKLWRPLSAYRVPPPTVHRQTPDNALLPNDWLSTASADPIADFEPEQDTLLCVWDDSTADAGVPDIAIHIDPEHSDQAQVWMGNRMVAHVSARNGDMSAADIAMIPLSSAKALGLTTH